MTSVIATTGIANQRSCCWNYLSDCADWLPAVMIDVISINMRNVVAAIG